MATPRFQTSATIKAAAIKRGAQTFRARTQSLPPPVGGWNARDSLADMASDDAVQLSNWFPLTTDVMMRKGYEIWATGLSGQCESLLPYNSPTTLKLFAAAGTSFYNVTLQGSAGAAVQTGLSNARWESNNFATSGGNFMYAVNGSDSPRLYDGTTWTTITGVSVPAITGVTTSNLTQVNVFKKRLWFVEKDSLKVWYLPVDSIAGAAQSLDFKSIAYLGGYLVAMGTWTVDAGTGSDDLAVFVTSQGQIIVYRGIDPANEVTWSLAGVWNVGAPIGKRCMIKFGGDLLINTFDGVFPMSQLLQSNTIDLKSALSDKIRLAMTDATSAYGANFGWDITLYPRGNMLIVNIPVSEGSRQVQFVMNTINKSWCDFSGWEANCFMLFDDEPYFGVSGAVYRAWSGLADNVADITGTAMQAFNYFGSRGQEKHFTMFRPTINTNGIPAILANVNVDYSLQQPTTPAQFSTVPVSYWDQATWDNGLWGGLYVLKDWQAVAGMGYCAAPVLSASVNGIEVHWMASDLVMEPGAVL